MQTTCTESLTTKCSWGSDTGIYFRPWSHAQWLYSCTCIRQQPELSDNQPARQCSTASGPQKPAAHPLLQHGARLRPNNCCWAFLYFAFETLGFFQAISMTPLQRGGYFGIYQGLNYTVRASFNNQCECHSRHTAVPAVPTAQDFSSHPCCLHVQCLTQVTKSIFALASWGSQNRDLDSPYIW